METILHILILTIFVSITTASKGRMMTGGWSDVQKPYPESLQKYAKFATAEYSMSSNSPYHLRLTEISNVRKQVVSGMNYKMTLKMAPSECKRSGTYKETEVDNCPLLACHTPTICNVTVWVQPWMKNDKKVTKSSCTQGKKTC